MAASSSDGCVRARLKETHIENAVGSATGVMSRKEFDNYVTNIKIEMNTLDDDELEFDMVGVDPVIANTLRRMLLVEVPGMAIDHVYIYQNTSIIPDEVLAHRVALIPIKANADLFTFPADSSDDDTSTERAGSEEDTIEFRLHVTCRGSGAGAGKRGRGQETEQRGESEAVYSSQLVWVPRGAQAARFPGGLAPAHSDIVIAKLVPGQEVELVAHCVKGLGRDHAKFSPVATTYYRFLPEIILREKIEGELAERLRDCFPTGVIEVREKKGKKRARVSDARRDNASGNVLLDAELRDKVELNKIKNHVIFTVESVGMMPAKQLVTSALKIMMNKCDTLLEELDEKPKPDEENV